MKYSNFDNSDFYQQIVTNHKSVFAWLRHISELGKSSRTLSVYFQWTVKVNHCRDAKEFFQAIDGLYWKDCVCSSTLSEWTQEDYQMIYNQYQEIHSSACEDQVEAMYQ